MIADAERMVHHLREHDWRKRAPAALQFLTGTPGQRPEAPAPSPPSAGEASLR